MKRYITLLLIICFLASSIAFSNRAFAYPNAAFKLEVSQPTGEKFNVTIIIYEDYTWNESDTGEIISKGEDGFWYYNTIENNELTISKSKFNIDPKPQNAITESELLKWREEKYANSIKAINLSKLNLSMQVGEMEHLSAIIESESKPFIESSVIWSADNNRVNIKTVDSYGTTALIKAIASGTVKIRATSKHAPSYYKECIVTITKASDNYKIDSKLNKSVVMMVGSSKAFINGKECIIDATNYRLTPIIKNKKVLLPMKFLIEKMGARVEWNRKSSAIEIKIGKETVKATIGSKIVMIGKKKTNLEVPVELINNVLYMSMKDLSELFGKKVIYNKELIVISESSYDISIEIINKTIALFNIDQNTEIALFPAPFGDEWGYIDNNGKVIIEPQFKDAMKFADGLAPVALGGKYGYINKSGKFVVEPIYDRVWEIRDGMGMVLKNNKCGYVDSFGKLIIEPKYDFGFTSAFSEGLACVGIDKKHGFIDKTGKIVIEPKYTLAFDFSEGMSAVYDKNIDKWGFIDKAGNYKIKPIYQFAFSFIEGLAQVRDSGNGKCGYIDITGKYIIEPQFEEACSFKESLAYVKNNAGKWGYIDTKGRTVIDYIFDGATEFSQGLAAVSKNKKGSYDRIYGFINKKGDLVIDYKYDNAESFHNGLAMIHIDNRIGYINKNGIYIWEPKGYSPFID